MHQPPLLLADGASVDLSQNLIPRKVVAFQRSLIPWGQERWDTEDHYTEKNGITKTCPVFHSRTVVGQQLQNAEGRFRIGVDTTDTPSGLILASNRCQLDWGPVLVVGFSFSRRSQYGHNLPFPEKRWLIWTGTSCYLMTSARHCPVMPLSRRGISIKRHRDSRHHDQHHHYHESYNNIAHKMRWPSMWWPFANAHKPPPSPCLPSIKKTQ